MIAKILRRLSETTIPGADLRIGDVVITDDGERRVSAIRQMDGSAGGPAKFVGWQGVRREIGIEATIGAKAVVLHPLSKLRIKRR